MKKHFVVLFVLVAICLVILVIPFTANAQTSSNSAKKLASANDTLLYYAMDQPVSSYVHVSVPVTEKGMTLMSELSIDRAQSPLMLKLLKIDGVTGISLENYTVGFHYEPLFRREQIKKQILAVVAKHNRLTTIREVKRRSR